MSVENSAPETGALGQRIEAIEKQVNEVHAGLRATRNTRWILLLGLVVVIAVAGKLFWGLGQKVMSTEFQQELSSKLQAHFTSNQDQYVMHVRTLANEVTPEIQKVLMEQSKKDTPKYIAALNKERDGLLESLKTQLQEKINARHQETLKKFETMLVEEFPEAKDEVVRTRMMANMQVAMAGMVEEYYIQEFQNELTAITDVWEKFPAASAPNPDDPPLERQLLGLLLDLMVSKAANGGSLLDAPSADATDAAANAPGFSAPLASN